MKGPKSKSPTKHVDPKTALTRTQEAKNCLQSAKKFLGESRNLRTDIKDGVTLAINKMYQLVRDAEEERMKEKKGDRKGGNKEDKRERQVTDTIEENRGGMLEAMERMMKESERRMEEYEKKNAQHIQKMDELKMALDQHRVEMKAVTYASVAAGHSGKSLPPSPALHSIVIAAKDETETGEEIIERVKKVARAKDGGMVIDKIRKVKDRKVIIGCSTKEARQEVKESLEGSETGLYVEEVRNRDPLLVLKDVLQSNTDDEIIHALRNQNGDLFSGLDGDDSRLAIKFRRKARNQHLAHIVLAVSPQLWQRAIGKGILRLDIQRVKVEDQSPLVQCSVCLGYGHSKKFCKDTVEKCSHCGGPHMRVQCESRLVGASPSCANCCKSGLGNAHHNAFDPDCPIRRRWDALARARVAYC